MTVWAAVLVAIVLDTLAELFWKLGVNRASSADLVHTLITCATQPFFLLAMFLFIPKYFNWMYVLSKAELSYAIPAIALSYVTVLAVSVFVLHEPITVHKLFGVTLVLAGVWMVSRTEVAEQET
jgi:drug/metabolite transporter (DMT)-like permease